MAGSVQHDPDLATSPGDGDDYFEGIDLRELGARLKQHKVVVGGFALIAVAVLWRIEFLSHLYFRLDDFIDLDKAIESPFDWKYLTYNGVGHLIIGVRAIGWLLARTSLYNWGLDSAIDLALVALSGLAALRLLRRLFGDRLAILIPLAVYLLCPLTLPGLGEWSSALEAIPLQLATFMALDAQVRYVRSGNRRYFAQALAWVAFGLLFFEKGLLLPPLLFAFTAAFFAGGGSWLAGMRVTLRRYWQDWAIYAVLMVAYAAVLAQSLKTSRVHPSAPGSAGAVWRLTWGLVVRTFVTGALGGPWRWFGGQTYALAAPASRMVALSGVVAIVVILASIWFRAPAWRAWSILGGWLLAADVVPIIIGRVNDYPLDLLASETRYVADAVPVLAICVGLAFWPLADSRTDADDAGKPGSATAGAGQLWQYAAGALAAAFVFGSLWSVQSYASLTASTATSAYVHNAAQALELVPSGAQVVDVPVPAGIILNHDGSYVLASQFIGDMERDKFGHHVIWVKQPRGIIDGLRIFGTDGRLYLAKVTGSVSAAMPANSPWHGCYPERDGRITVRFVTPAPSTSSILRIGYIWDSRLPSTITVSYGSIVHVIEVQRGLHAEYVPISGIAKKVVFSQLGGGRMCIGDAEAGALSPNTARPALPPQ